MAGLGCTMSLAFVLVLQALTFTGAVKLRQSAIISHLRDTSDPDVIPIPDNNERPLEVNIDLYLVKILDVDRERNEIEVIVWLDVSWNYSALAWDITKEGFNFFYVTIPSHYLWLPDITVYNAVRSLEVVSPAVVLVVADGTVHCFPSFGVRVWCDLQDVASHNGANCSLKLGSWTHYNKSVSLSNSGNGISTRDYLATPNYDFLATFATKQSHEDHCCPGEMRDEIEFSFNVRKHDLLV